jgi:hypothetical protein
MHLDTSNQGRSAAPDRRNRYNTSALCGRTFGVNLAGNDQSTPAVPTDHGPRILQGPCSLHSVVRKPFLSNFLTHQGSHLRDSRMASAALAVIAVTLALAAATEDSIATPGNRRSVIAEVGDTVGLV